MQNYDIIVVGGGTSGCAAAYTAGKLGLKTLLIEKNIHLGGAITSGLVVPAMNAGENQINTDFFIDFICEMKKNGGQITYQSNPGWFNPELAKIVLERMLLNVGVELYYGTSINSVNIKNSRILDVSLIDNLLSVHNDTIYNNDKILLSSIGARYVIDATGDCKIAKLCNCKFINKNEEIQPISLRFIMGGVNLNAFSRWLLDFDNDRNVTTVENIDENIHLSTAYTWDNDKVWALKPLFDDAVEKGILKDKDRNYFQIFTIAGMPSSVAFNCPRIVENADIYNIKEVSSALSFARESILRLSKFCKQYFPGFENAYISNIADQLGIRVSNRIKGKYIYTIEDLKSGKNFKNPVLRSNYPVDIHSAQKDNSTLESVQEYELPVEALMSDDIENLFVTGRCISADFMAQGALRIQPNCFSMGEGAVKYIAKLIRQS